MLGNLFGWLMLLFEPLADWLYIAPIPIPPRLLAANRPWQEIITGVYGVPPLIKIHDRDGAVRWSFEREDVTQKLPTSVKHCLYSNANDATEMKWVRGGRSIAAVYSELIVVINHHPENPATDKQLTFTACRDNKHLWNAHTVEALPGDRLAVATTGQRPWDGILVYNMSSSLPLMAKPPIMQNITGLRAIHGMIWEEKTQILWACGTDAAADGSDKRPAYGVVQGYPYNPATGLLSKDDRYVYRLADAIDIDAEWGKGNTWWAGPHDLVPIPNERKFIVTNDIGFHLLDLEVGNFTLHYQDVVEAYMKGFEVTTADRHGTNRAGDWVELPQSDLKSLNLAPDGSFIYVQSLMRKYRGFHTSLVTFGQRRKINIGDEIYRSRWWGDMDGWPKPQT